MNSSKTMHLLPNLHERTRLGSILLWTNNRILLLIIANSIKLWTQSKMAGDTGTSTRIWCHLSTEWEAGVKRNLWTSMPNKNLTWCVELNRPKIRLWRTCKKWIVLTIRSSINTLACWIIHSTDPTWLLQTLQSPFLRTKSGSSSRI